MKEDKLYYAFISYSHKDEEWAKWLQHEFEHYHLPTTLNGKPNLPERFRPIFRDIDELSGGELKPQISEALKDSAYLIIICSPNSAKSPYVDEEIREFIDIGKKNGISNICNIFPFIIEGVPHSKENQSLECFPQALKELPSELIAGDVTKHGREHAFVKILAGTLQTSQIKFSMLWNQFERDRIEEERKEREKRNRLLLLESRYLSEKAIDIAPFDSQLAKMLVLRALPASLNDIEDRPYCIEAEDALRKITHHISATIKWRKQDLSKTCIGSNDNYVIAVAEDGSLRICDITTGQQIGSPLKGQIKATQLAVFSHNEKLVAAIAEDGSILLWETETGKVTANMQDNESASTEFIYLEFTHNNKLLIAASRQTLWIWDVKECALLHKIAISGTNGFALDRDSRWIALANMGCSIEIYDLKSASLVKTISKAHSESLTSIDFSPNGENVVTAAFDGKIKVWNWMQEKALFSRNVGIVYGAYAPAVLSAKYSFDGKYIVTASRDNLIRIWDATYGDQCGSPLVGHLDAVLEAHFSKDGSTIKSLSMDGTIRTWDIATKVPYKIVGRAQNIPFEEKVSHGDLTLEIKECDIQIVDNTTKEVVKTLSGHTKCVSSAIFSYDGSMIASTSYDGTARLWDTLSGKQIGANLAGHTEAPHTSAFNPDNDRLVTASKIELKVWDTKSNTQIGSDMTFFDHFFRVMFTNDGKGIIAETKDDYDVWFDWMPIQELIDKTQSEIGSRQFSDSEKKRFYLD